MKISFILLLAVVLTGASKVIAQTQSSGLIPCVHEPTVGRPVLKKRSPKPDDQPTREFPNAELSNSQPCDRSVPEASTTPSEAAAAVEFEGLTAVDKSDFQIQLRQRLAPSMISLTNDTSVAEAEKLIKELLSDRGYRHAKVSSRLDRRENERVVTFVISEGARFAISEIHFEGGHIFSEQLLAAGMNQCLARFDDERWSAFRADTFDYCLHTLANFQRSQGYLQAKFGEPKIQEVGDELIVTINSDEGVLYRLGHLEIEGADHVAEQEVRDMIDMRTGDIANGEKLAKALYENLKAAYGEKGFIQYTAEIQPEFHSEPGVADGIVDFKIFIEEGRRFKIRRIFFKGDDLPERGLRQLLSLHDGDVYNQKLFEESVKRINDTGWFNPVDKDKDVDYRTNEEEGLVDVVMQLTKRMPASVSRSDP